jgi:hypothetical protein
MKGDEERARASGCAFSKPLDTRTLADDVARHIDASSGVGHA